MGGEKLRRINMNHYNCLELSANRNDWTVWWRFEEKKHGGGAAIRSAYTNALLTIFSNLKLGQYPAPAVPHPDQTWLLKYRAGNNGQKLIIYNRERGLCLTSTTASIPTVSPCQE